jgi:riboflavin kinase/FMN adenylyltransferase
MNVIAWNELPDRPPYARTGSALSVGVFDGVHLGHRDILGRLVAGSPGLLPVAVTFSGNPQNVLRPSPRIGDILTIDQKLLILRSLGVAVTVMIDFSVDFSKMTATSFFTTLASAFCIKKIVEGENFHFGSGREAGRPALKEWCDRGGVALEVPATVLYRGMPVSSTRVRDAIRSGLIEEVRDMLALDYSIVIPRAALVRTGTGTLAIAKAALSQVVPENGRYRCLADTEAGQCEAVVEVDKENFFIRSGVSTVKTISFKEKLS